MLTHGAMRLLLPMLVVTIILAVPVPARAQITFSEKTAELEALEASVNNCAARQRIPSCLEALSRSHVLQISHGASENSADGIMRNAVMLLPLHMLGELYNRKGSRNISCGYALSGERQLHRLLRDMDSLMSQDPAAFKNINKTKQGLEAFQAQFDKTLARCG